MNRKRKRENSRRKVLELKMGYNMDQHDYDVRLRAARNFLKDGDKVKVIVNLSWRENEFRNIAIELMRRIQNFVGELATEESKNFHDRNIFISLVPNKAILQKAVEPPKKKDKSAANEVSAGMSACKFTRGFNYGTLGGYSRSHFVGHIPRQVVFCSKETG